MTALSNLITTVGLELSALDQLREARAHCEHEAQIAKLRQHADYMARMTADAFAAWQRETGAVRK